MFPLIPWLFLLGDTAFVRAEAPTPQKTNSINTNSAKFDKDIVTIGILIFAAGAITIAMAFRSNNDEATNKATTSGKSF
ncbi:hypothetical protein I9W82_005312 [Candida metapsilosis]|uniref:Uncharacterized protein n=1 Tax=Candida metapsilosis TaxID=273372 RepID=A0A8H7ZF32_9ASCO|nr:hypothetical protein I9W82_005312 [Candida metapsilosis]